MSANGMMTKSFLCNCMFNICVICNSQFTWTSFTKDPSNTTQKTVGGSDGIDQNDGTFLMYIAQVLI